MSQKLIDDYAAGSEKLAMSIRGLKADDLAWKPDPDAKIGRWSIQQILAHLADSDAVSADRMKRIIAEDQPQLLAYDENRWAASLAYDKRSAQDSLESFTQIRNQMLTILTNIPATAWDRIGIHAEAGKMTLTQMLQRTTRHSDHHLEFIHAKRRAMGKEMW